MEVKLSELCDNMYHKSAMACEQKYDASVINKRVNGVEFQWYQRSLSDLGMPFKTSILFAKKTWITIIS